jgi:uncharacterized membrane protein YciS (DUF1049 family)
MKSLRFCCRLACIIRVLQVNTMFYVLFICGWRVVENRWVQVRIPVKRCRRESKDTRMRLLSRLEIDLVEPDRFK